MKYKHTIASVLAFQNKILKINMYPYSSYMVYMSTEIRGALTDIADCS